MAAGEIGAGVGRPHQGQCGQQPARAVAAAGLGQAGQAGEVARVQQAQRGPGREHRHGAGGQLEGTRPRAVGGGEARAPQPQRRQQPGQCTHQGDDLEQGRVDPGGVARGPYQQHHQRQVQPHQHDPRQGVLDPGQLQPLPQTHQQDQGGQGGQPGRGQQHDGGDRGRGHDQGGEDAGTGHAGLSAPTWALVRPKRRSRPA